MAATSPVLYQELITVLEAYLGPSAERFMRRHAESHLHKSLDQISCTEIAELTAWIKLSLGMLSHDDRVVTACEKDMLELCTHPH